MPTIRDVMQTKLVTVTPDTPVVDAIRLLVEHHISGLPVVDDRNGIVGVLSEKDLLDLFSHPAERRTVGSLMTKNPRCIDVDAELVEVFDVLMSNDFRRVLISDKGKLVGLVSRADLMPPILDALLDLAST